MQNIDGIVNVEKILAAAADFAWSRKIFLLPQAYVYSLLLQDKHLHNRLGLKGIDAAPLVEGLALLTDEAIKLNQVSFSTQPDLRAKDVIANKSAPDAPYLVGYGPSETDRLIEAGRLEFDAALIIIGASHIIEYIASRKAQGRKLTACGLFDYLTKSPSDANPDMLVLLGLANDKESPTAKQITVSETDDAVAIAQIAVQKSLRGRAGYT